MQAKGGGLAFVQSSDNMDENPGPALLAYVNGDHEYAVFNPHGEETYKRKVRHTDGVLGEEGTGIF